MIHNIFKNILPFSDKERTDIILNKGNFSIERIVSYGYTSPDGFWYNQDKNEWVLLLTGEAEIEFKDETVIQLKSGDYILIPAHQEHRVKSTSKEPNCIWLTLNFD